MSNKRGVSAQVPQSTEKNSRFASPAARIQVVLSFAAAAIYFLSNPQPQNYYDYTFRVAANMLGGRIGFTNKQPSWLNEFVPFEGFYYSVFPLGSVISMMPLAVMKVVGLISEMPSALIAALCAGVSAVFLFAIARRYEIESDRMIVMVCGVMFGTWTWTNLTMGGAWQLALGFALVGELGAIYFTVYDRRPLLAGVFFALAFGNRTEVLLTAPIFLWFLIFRDAKQKRRGDAQVEGRGDIAASPARLLSWSNIRTVAAFCVVPFVLGVLTLAYNFVRFHSPTDFGYARIPGVLDEPWYNHGIFSIRYIPGQMWEMLLRPWKTRAMFPYLLPDPFSSSVLWSSPFLLFAFRRGALDKALKWVSWLAVIVLLILLWMHGNSGGWQFGYRYAIVCLPWLFVIMLESSPKKMTMLEWAAYGFAFVANIYATWLFHWTEYLKS